MKVRKNLFTSIVVFVTMLVLSVTTVFAATHIGSISGGGQIIEEAGPKRPDWLVVSFGGWLNATGFGNYEGEWQVNFHDVGDDAFDKSTFHTTDIRVVNFYKPGSGETTCYDAFNFTAYGEWNGMPGYKLIFRGGDFGSPGFTDTVRVELYYPASSNTPIYDTHAEYEFLDESSCVGTARTGLDAGNLTITVP